MDAYSLSLLAHIFGVALGAGAAFTGDYLFLTSLRDDKRIGEKELRLLHAAGKVVWVGVTILVLSGAAMLWMGDFGLLSSSAFRAKMTIVGIIILNGFAFHLYHLPFLKRVFRSGEPISDPADEKRAVLVFASGAVSSVSWISAILLGYARVLPYGYAAVMGVYALAVAGAVAAALVLKRFVFPRFAKPLNSSSVSATEEWLVAGIFAIGAALIASSFMSSGPGSADGNGTDFEASHTHEEGYEHNGEEYEE